MSDAQQLRPYAHVLAVQDLAATSTCFRDCLGFAVAWSGAEVRMAPVDRPYGMREMLVATPDGHRIMFGQTLRT